MITNLNRKLLFIYLTLGILFFILVIYLFVKNEILPEINPERNHKVRLSGIRVIKNDFFNQNKFDPNQRYPNENLIADNPVREKWQSYFLLVNENDNSIYAKSTPFHATVSEPPFSVQVQDDALIPLSTLSDKYRLDMQEDGKIIGSFKVSKLKDLFTLTEKPDTVTEEKTMKIISFDKKVILFLIFTID